VGQEGIETQKKGTCKMPTLTVKKTRKAWWDKEATITTEVVHGVDENALFATYFKEFANRLKYCNDVRTEIIESDMKAAYSVWISDVNNYANNGGDMW
jgi:hypothetical protein